MNWTLTYILKKLMQVCMWIHPYFMYMHTSYTGYNNIVNQWKEFETLYMLLCNMPHLPLRVYQVDSTVPLLTLSLLNFPWGEVVLTLVADSIHVSSSTTKLIVNHLNLSMHDGIIYTVVVNRLVISQSTGEIIKFFSMQAQSPLLSTLYH